MNGKLKNHCCYLSGPMDRAIDGGEQWRQIAQKELHKIGIGVFNPCLKPSDDFVEDKNFRHKIENLKEIGHYIRVKSEMKQIIGYDLRMLDLSSFVIMHISPKIYSCGTFWECCYAVQQHKPILTFCMDGIKYIPNWIFGLIDDDYMFDSLDKLLDFIIKINNGENNHLIDTKKWKFFDFNKVYGRIL